MFVGEARISDVIASRRLASDWLCDDITWKCIGGYDSASAPLEPRGGCSTIHPPVFSSTQRFLRFRLRSSSYTLSLSLSHSRSVIPTLSPSRSIAFCVVLTLVSLFPIFPTTSRPPSLPGFPFSSPAGNFSISAARMVRRFPQYFALAKNLPHTLSQIRFYTSSLSSRSPPHRAVLTSSLPFD